MRIKSKYKKFADGGAVVANPETVAPPPPISDDPYDHGTIGEIDDASEAFKRQIAALRHAEERAASRQAEEVEAQRRLDAARAEHQRYIENARKFVDENPHLKQRPDLLKDAEELAHQAAREEGHAMYGPEFLDNVRKQFDMLLSMQAPATPRLQESLPEISVPERGSRIVSAPVSRDVPSSIVREDRDYRDDRVGRVTLSVEEKQIARASGISEQDYARGKLELQKRKRDGFYDQ